jgi:glycosyltransferase involved in cell wall biosynthesis
MRVLLSIPSLMPGGAERQLVALAAGLSARGNEVLVVALDQGGPLAKDLGGAKLVVLDKRGRWDNLRVALGLARLLRSFQARTHYAFLSTPCVLGALIKPLAPSARLIMGLRGMAVDHGVSGQGHAGSLLHLLEARLSPLADLVIANSHAGRRDALARGFKVDKTVVVPNGIDTARCQPDRALGLPLREAWDIRPGETLIGHVARLDPLKDHQSFLRAAALLHTRRPGLRFVCVGDGPEAYAAKLRNLAEGLGLGERLVWAGVRSDMPEVFNALDLVSLSSSSEGFPNVLCEAMACGVPCVATEAGDSQLILAQTGEVAPIGDPVALAQGMERCLDRLDREGEALRSACRDRIVAHFSLERMVEATEALLTAVADRTQS